MQDHFKMLYNIGYKRFCNAGEILFFQGDIPRKILVLLSGKVRLYKTSAFGKEETIHQINAKSFIAEMPSFMGFPYPANAQCVDECEVLEIEIDFFKKYCAQNPDFSLSFIASLCQKIKILESIINENSQTLLQKITQFLLTNEDILDTFSQKNIAQKLNTTPESLSRALREMKAKELICTQKGKIVILDKERLKECL